MTIIVACEGVMAADGGVFQGDAISSFTAKKIITNPEGTIFGREVLCVGLAGGSSDVDIFLEKMKEGIGRETSFERNVDVSGIAVIDNGDVLNIRNTDDGKYLDFWGDTDHQTSGAGWREASNYLKSELELVGCHDEHSAISAVAFAIKYNVWCAGEITAYDYINKRWIID